MNKKLHFKKMAIAIVAMLAFSVSNAQELVTNGTFTGNNNGWSTIGQASNIGNACN